MIKKRNPYLTPAMEKVLDWMAHDVEDGGELVVEGGEAWYGVNRTSCRVVSNLLRLILIRDETPNGAMTDCKYRYYTINEEGRKVLRNPRYVPFIVRHLRDKR